MDNKKFGFKKQFASFAILILLIAITFWIINSQFQEIDINVLMTTLKRMSPMFLLAGIACLFMYIIFEGMCMSVIARPLGHKIGFIRATIYSAIDLYFSALTPSATGGQPAVAYYMAKDGIGLTKSSTILLVNIAQYTMSLILMGLVVLIARPRLITSGGWGMTALFVFGFVINVVLIVICLMCMFSQRLVRRVCKVVLRLLCKLHLMKHEEEKLLALEGHLADYKECVTLVKARPGMLAIVLLLNTLQRFATFSIAYMVYRGLGFSGYSYWDLIAIQTVTAVAVNSLPLPGAVGAAEGAFLVLYAGVYSPTMLMPAMLLTRGISYYLCFVICGTITISNHIRVVKRAGGKNRC
ncbi:MAG: lysylphosphatidylglycerol synthase transmembrane domain-containing protein [Clostridia bacterium]